MGLLNAPGIEKGYFERNHYNLGISASCDIVQYAAEPHPIWITGLQGDNTLFSGYPPVLKRK